jgi:hypothetical protein
MHFSNCFGGFAIKLINNVVRLSKDMRAGAIFTELSFPRLISTMQGYLGNAKPA